jgi:hypothetical protein
MAIKCAECNTDTCEVVDSETDVKGKAFVLLECRKCKRSVLVPREQWKMPGTGGKKASRKS